MAHLSLDGDTSSVGTPYLMYVCTKHDEKILLAWMIRYEIANNLDREIHLGLGIFPVFD